MGTCIKEIHAKHKERPMEIRSLPLAIHIGYEPEPAEALAFAIEAIYCLTGIIYLLTRNRASAARSTRPPTAPKTYAK
jgi:hypothetical protein